MTFLLKGLVEIYVKGAIHVHFPDNDCEEYIYIFNNGTLIGKGVVGFDRPDVSIQYGKESYRSGFIGYIYSINNIKNKFTISDLYQDCFFSY